jgi:hypothetical protein
MRMFKPSTHTTGLAWTTCAALLVYYILGSIVSVQAQDSSVSEEFKLKAAFVYNFVRFVDWPNAPASRSERSITICVIGQNPFGDTLDGIISSGDLENVHVNYSTSAPLTIDCNIAVINEPVERSARALLDSFKGKSTLTVSNVYGFLDLGGIIEFTLKDGKVRFYIDEARAKSVGLTISSKLSALALRP